MLITHGGTSAGGRSAPQSGTGNIGRGAPSAPHRTATADRAPTDVRAARPRIRLIHQIAIILAAVAAYFLVRGATEADYAHALRNAQWLIDLESMLGLYHERALQSSLASSPPVTTVMNWVYIWGHWPVIAVVLLWLARRHPAIYLRTRNAMLVSGAIGLVVFVSFPVAPPRLAGIGMIDTVTVGSDAYRVLQPAMFTNQFAAMPSLHVGWDLLIGLAVLTAARRPLVRALGVLMPVAMFVAVVLTANHFLVDAIVGAALTATCWILCGRWTDRRWADRRRRHDAPTMPTNPAYTMPRPRVPIEVLDAQSVGIDRAFEQTSARHRAAEHELAR